MAQAVSVTVTTDTGDEALRFSGSGTLTRDARAAHLRYTAAGPDGHIASEVHWGAGRAVVHTGDYRMLLDPRRPTHANIQTAGGALETEIVTHCVRAELHDSGGAVFLHYTLSADGTPWRTLRVTLAWKPIRRENA